MQFNFKSKFAAQKVYVLMDYDKFMAGPCKEFPVAVVTNETLANDFYQHDPKNRNAIPFNLDEAPEHTGVPSTVMPKDKTIEKPQKPTVDPQTLQRVQDTSSRVDSLRKRVQKILKNRGKKR
jgi:hypothetical protein